jgi:uncharacterized small protein (DUF1192 family)
MRCWYREWDSNPHGLFAQRILSPPRLPFRHPGSGGMIRAVGRTISRLMGRLEKRIFNLNDEIARLEWELDQARAELDVHRHLADDAARDAAVSDSPFDREDERETTADVARFERLVDHLLDKIDATTTKRDLLLDKMV